MHAISVVTGAGSGIGRALTIELAKNRGKVVLGVGRHKQTLEATRAACPDRIRIVEADVGSEEGRQKIVAALDTYSRIEYLVHNAAVLDPVIPLKDVTLADWRKHQQINTEGPLFLTQKLLPKLKQGRVLHISSGAAHHAYAGWGAYCTSKSALHMIWQVWKEELATHSTGVGSLRPGVVDTPMQNKVRAAERTIFPRLDKFVDLKENGKLLDPKTVARFIAQVLIKTSDAVFTEKEWDIREDWDGIMHA